jgi:hypothetical protein
MQLYTQQEALKMLKITRKTLFSLRKVKQIKIQKVGRQLRFTKKDIKNLMS